MQNEAGFDNVTTLLNRAQASSREEIEMTCHNSTKGREQAASESEIDISFSRHTLYRTNGRFRHFPGRIIHYILFDLSAWGLMNFR
jgi:hypothetical protein